MFYYKTKEIGKEIWGGRRKKDNEFEILQLLTWFHSLHVWMKYRENGCHNQLLIPILMHQGGFVFTLFCFH